MYRSVKWQRLTKITSQNKENQSFRWFLVDILARYVSMRKRGTCCIAPKLRGAHFEGSKTLRGADWGVQNSAGQICLQSLSVWSGCKRNILFIQSLEPILWWKLENIRFYNYLGIASPWSQHWTKLRHITFWWRHVTLIFSSPKKAILYRSLPIEETIYCWSQTKLWLLCLVPIKT